MMKFFSGFQVAEIENLIFGVFASKCVTRHIIQKYLMRKTKFLWVVLGIGGKCSAWL